MVLPAQEQSIRFLKVKEMFERGEYERVAQLIEITGSSDRDCISLSLLSEHLSLQKKEFNNSAPHPSGTGSSKLKHVAPKGRSLEADRTRLLTKAADAHSRYSNDSVINHIYAAVLLSMAGQSDDSFATEILVQAIKLCEFNWAAWMELATVSIPIPAELEDSLSGYELFPFYKLERLMHLRKYKSALSHLTSLKHDGEWSYIDEIEGACAHNLRDFDAAIVSFEKIVRRDKFHIGGMDLFSNCLFVKENTGQLFQLASQWVQVDPNALETCVIVGNYYSLMSDHEKAALFFKRATLVDPTNINAWLLLGHELIELRNPSAALSAYQQATRCTSAERDVRPWYAMGQLFELINQFAFAVYYHNVAARIDAKDSRIWKALSACYLKLNRVDESNQCNLKLRALLDSSTMAI